MITKIGLDVGHTTTGVAIWSKGKFTEIFTTDVISAQDYLQKKYVEMPLYVYLEDPNLNKSVFVHRYIKGNRAIMSAGQLHLLMKIAQNIGQNKGYVNLMIDFLKSRAIPFTTVKPTKTKTKSAEFKKLTGYTAPCSQHGRDAAMLIYHAGIHTNFPKP